MTTGFEGAEKILQIKITSVKPNMGLKGIPKSTWHLILDTAKCSIVNTISMELCSLYIVYVLGTVLLISYLSLACLSWIVLVFLRRVVRHNFCV